MFPTKVKSSIVDESVENFRVLLFSISRRFPVTTFLSNLLDFKCIEAVTIPREALLDMKSVLTT